MQMIISTRGLTVSKADKDALTRRLAKIEPMLPALIEAKAMLSREKHRRTAALTLVAKHHAFHAEETAGDLQSAVDAAVTALVRQVREHKDRVTSRKVSRSRRRPAGPAGAGRPGPLRAPAVPVRRVALAAMSVAEAAAALAATGEDALLFTDTATDTIGAVYRRRDGSVAALEASP